MGWVVFLRSCVAPESTLPNFRAKISLSRSQAQEFTSNFLSKNGSASLLLDVTKANRDANAEADAEVQIVWKTDEKGRPRASQHPVERLHPVCEQQKRPE